MSISRTIPRAALIITVLVLGAAATVFAGGRDGDPPPAPARPDPQACADLPGRFDLGPKHDAATLERGRLCEPAPASAMAPAPAPAPPSRGINAEVAAYGDCRPVGDSAGCMPPVQVQTWSACDRYYAQYAESPAPDGSVIEHRRTRLRGVDAALFDEGRRIELYGGDVTVVIFAPDPDTAMSAVKEVRGQVGGRAVGTADPVPAARQRAC
jgi:hypothetical protein